MLTASSALCLLVTSFKHRDNLHSIKSSHNVSIKAQNRIQAVEVMSTCYKSRHWTLLCLIWSHSLVARLNKNWSAHGGERYIKYSYAGSQNKITPPPKKKEDIFIDCVTIVLEKLFLVIRLFFGVGMRPLACWDYGSISRWEQVRLSVVSVRVVRKRSLRRADHSSRGALPNVVCPMSMIATSP